MTAAKSTVLDAWSERVASLKNVTEGSVTRS